MRDCDLAAGAILLSAISKHERNYRLDALLKLMVVALASDIGAEVCGQAVI